jgi:hypothetical protein
MTNEFFRKYGPGANSTYEARAGANVPQLSALERLAIDVAIYAPARQTKYVGQARIPWSVIHKIREEMERCGYDWSAIKEAWEAKKAERT